MNENPIQSNIELNEEINLSRRTRKKFNKVKNIFNEKIEQLENEKSQLIHQIDSMKNQTSIIEKNNNPESFVSNDNILDSTNAYRDYIKAKQDSENIQKELFPYSSSMSNYGSEIIFFSVIVGLIFDFLLWKDIFAGKFGQDSWAERAERASAVIMSFSYAFICSQLGASYAVKMLSKKRLESSSVQEQQIYKKSTAKDSFAINIFLFVLLSTLSTVARFTQDYLSLSDKFILSLAATSIGLVISAIAYWYTDVYEHFIKIAKNKEIKAKKTYYRSQKGKL